MTFLTPQHRITDLEEKLNRATTNVHYWQNKVGTMKGEIIASDVRYEKLRAAYLHLCGRLADAGDDLELLLAQACEGRDIAENELPIFGEDGEYVGVSKVLPDIS